MEEGNGEQRLAGFRKFLKGFVVERDSPSIPDDPILFRGSTVGGFRLQATDVPAEILDWALLYLHQRKCPQDLAWILAREVQSRIEALLPSIVPPITNGGTTDADSPDEGQYLLDSTLLYGEMLGHLQEVCSHLSDSQEDLAFRNSVCQPGQYQTSLVALRNTRRKMEDRHVVIPDLNAVCSLADGPRQSYYAVFDGHSGAEAANFCSAHLHWNLVQHPKFECDPEAALKDCFATTEDQFLQRSQREGIKSGCTAVCCLIRDKTLHLAWVGDSQAFLVKKGMPITIMAPHKPDRTDEKERVERMGGCVMHVGTWRVNGILAVSRALGDFEHKPCVSSEPDVVQLQLDGEEDFLVLACDGLWDTLAPSDVTAAIYHFVNQEIEDMDDIAGQVAQQAIERGSSDNVTVIIVFLKDLKTITTQSTVPSMLNHSANPFYAVGNALDSAGLIFENGDGVYDQGMKNSNSVQTNGPQCDIFPHHGGLMPEQTSISELPTPPIEDLIEAGNETITTESMQGAMNPFESGEHVVGHGSHAKEIASAILNSAFESASQEDGKSVEHAAIVDTSGEQPFVMDTHFFSGHGEMNQVVEDLHVQNKSDEVDFLSSHDYSTSDFTSKLPDSTDKFSEYVSDVNVQVDPFSSLQGQCQPNAPLSPGSYVHNDLLSNFQETDFSLSKVPLGTGDFQNDFQVNLTKGDPQSFEHSNKYNEQSLMAQHQFPVETVLVSDMQSVIESKPSELHHRSEYSEMEGLSSEMLEEAQLELEDVQSRLMQSVQQLSGLSLLSDNIIQSEHSSQGQEPVFHNPSEVILQAKHEVEKHTDDMHQEEPAVANFEGQLTSAYQDNEEKMTFTAVSEEYQEQLRNFNPFEQPQQTQDMYGFPEETPSTIRSLQGVPEMIGIYEDVPGIQTSEPLLAPEPVMTTQKEVLAAFEDILVPSSPDQAPGTTIADLLSPSDSLEISEPGQTDSALNMVETTPVGVQADAAPSADELTEMKGIVYQEELALSDSLEEAVTSVDLPEEHAPSVCDQDVPSTEEVLEEPCPLLSEVLGNTEHVPSDVLEKPELVSNEALEESTPVPAVLGEPIFVSADVLEEQKPVTTDILEEKPAPAELLGEQTPSAEVMEERVPSPTEALKVPTSPAELVKKLTPSPAEVVEEPTPPPAEVVEELTPSLLEVHEELMSSPFELPEKSTPTPSVDTPAESIHPVDKSAEIILPDVLAEHMPVGDSPNLDSVEVKETEIISVETVNLESVPVQNSSLVDIIAPQISVPELVDPEDVANLLAADVPPTPEVVLEKIPDGVPEADGVTEDSDSEKDGGWSYVSTKRKDAEEPDTKSKVVAASTEAVSVVAPAASTAPASATVKKTTSKEAAKTSTSSKTVAPKVSESKLKGKPAPTKPVASSTSSVLKKTPSEPVKKPAATTLVKAKASPTMAAKMSTKTSTSSSTTVTKDSEVKSSATKSATLSRPAPTLARKTTPTAKPPSSVTKTTPTVPSTVTKTTPTAPSAVTRTSTIRTSTMKQTKPATATTTTTTTRPTAATAPARPASSTLYKPAAKPTTTMAARPTSGTTATLSKKPAGTVTSKTTTAVAKVPPARPTSTVSRAPRPSPETKQTKDTTNKHLVTQPSTLKSKQLSPAVTKASNKATTSPVLSKSSPRTSTGGKAAAKTGTVSSKPITKPVAKEETNEMGKAEKEEAAKPEPEKGSLEEKGKENQAVDSGLASPESPVSPQLSLVNGNHQSEAQIEDKATAAVLEQAELN